MSGTDPARSAQPKRCPVLPMRVLCAVRYCPRACYAMSGTTYAPATRCPSPVLPTRVLRAIRYRLRACYAMSGTAYARATRCPVLRRHTARAARATSAGGAVRAGDGAVGGRVRRAQEGRAHLRGARRPFSPSSRLALTLTCCCAVVVPSRRHISL
eukprot:1927046-Rhodomonas_salina.1